MPIVVKHEPSAAAVLGMSRIAGEGAFNKWKTEFEARQKQYAFQNLLSGMSAGQSLAAPFINIAGQQAQRGFQAEQARLGRQFTAEQRTLDRSDAQEMARLGHLRKMEFTEQFGQKAQYELQRGNQVADRARQVNGLLAGLQNMYGRGAPLENDSSGRRRYPDHFLAELARAGDPAPMQKMFTAGMNAMQGSMQAEMELDGDYMERKLRAKIDTENKEREMRYHEGVKLRNQIISNPNNPLTWGGENGQPYMSTDAEFARTLNEHARSLSAKRLGVNEMPNSADWRDKSIQITPWDFAIKGPNGWKIESITGGPNGRARRAGGTSKDKRFPALGEPWTADQVWEFTKERDKRANEAVQRSQSSLEAANGEWVTQIGVLNDEIKQARIEHRDETNAGKKAELKAELEDLERKREVVRANPPRGISFEQAREDASLGMYRDYNTAPPRLGHPGASPTAGGEYPFRPFGVRPFGGTQEEARARSQQWLDAPANPRWSETIKDFAPGTTRRGLLKRFMGERSRGGFGMTQSQAREAFRRMEQVEFESKRKPTGPPELLRREGPSGQQPGRQAPEMLQRPPGQTRAPSPRDMPSVPGPASIPSRIAGSDLSNVAFDGLKKLGGVNDAPEILSIIRNPRISDELGKWVSSGKSVLDWPPVQNLYRGAQSQEAARARRTQKGKPISPPPAGGVAGARGAISRTFSKGELAVQQGFQKRREMAAGIIQSAVKFSMLAGTDQFDVAYIPAPNGDEFKALVAKGQLKAGDVIISPPSQTTDAQFMIVTKRMLAEMSGGQREGR